MYIKGTFYFLGHIYTFLLRSNLPWHLAACFTNGTLPRHTPHLVALVLSPLTNLWGILCWIRWGTGAGGASCLTECFTVGVSRALLLVLDTGVGEEIRTCTAALMLGVLLGSAIIFSLRAPFSFNTERNYFKCRKYSLKILPWNYDHLLVQTTCLQTCFLV